jgi:hypothetical protein
MAGLAITGPNANRFADKTAGRAPNRPVLGAFEGTPKKNVKL